MGIENIVPEDIRYHLLAFDADGRERSESDGPHSRVLLAEAADTAPTDVFLFSHGWMADIPAAREQYSKWLRAMASCTADRAALHDRPGGFQPLLIGLHWPSKAWGDEEFGPASFATDIGEPQAGPHDAVGDFREAFVDEYAEWITDTAATREALRTLADSTLNDAAPMTLPADVRRAYHVIDAEAAMSSAGVGAAPGDDRDSFDAEAMYQACQLAELVSYGDPVLGGLLAPLRVLTFWYMKKRARIFGERGAASLLDALRQAAPAARFHLMGHSFGCIVATAAVAGAPQTRSARSPIQSLVLAQGAMSLWSFCSSIPSRPDRSGYFRRVVAEELVDGPILTTTSVHDRAVRTFYPLAAGARDQVDFDPGDLPTYGGIGTYGARGPGVDIVDDELHPISESYDFRSHMTYNLRADSVIAHGGGVMGAHSDIAQAPVAHAVWHAARQPM